MDTRAPLRSALLVVGASLLLGGLTSWAQGVLPDELASFANSSSGWTVLTAVLVAGVRPSLRGGAVLGAVSFVSLVLGYTIASELRGLAYDPVLWSAIGVVAGPFVGAAAAAVAGRHAVRAALGAGVLAGVLVADGLRGLLVVGDTTSPVYWVLCLVVAAVLLAVMVLRLRTPAAAVRLVLGTAVAAGAISLGYAALGSA